MFHNAINAAIEINCKHVCDTLLYSPSGIKEKINVPASRYEPLINHIIVMKFTDRNNNLGVKMC